MKDALISICAVSAAMCWAAPTLTIDFVNQNPDSRLVTIGYTVGNEPAVVTLDSIVADGVPLDESKLADVQDMDLPTYAIRYLISQKANIFAIPGATSVRQIVSNAKAGERKLTEAELSFVK